MFHGSPVSVHVLATLDEPSIYAREILLRRISDGEVVQVGFVRLDPKALSSNVLAEIRQQLAPLGRILIDRGVLRHVRFDRLYRVDLSRKSQESCYLAGECSLWGRTARIHVHGHAVIDLLEIAVLPGQ
jgi:chorismate-pyruvate lyase